MAEYLLGSVIGFELVCIASYIVGYIEGRRDRG